MENDIMQSILQEKIESLRFEMINQALINGSLTHEKVISVSQLLDRYILLYQKLILEQAKLKFIS
ncbi:aspartyl-phosphate phosphatase Spo0E family protein [Paenibacillus sp. Soil766]|uniref:aspartyl-phosphate phosphatase Spo0E family protein n=1 Tax=Paenibacillus sp. Soil766 TaxID=1736404 RepID=UPI001F35F40A|nr:aspartyl-phosphate phosphatase Spo0E family protein [Paenibacillus sp. Soil766]